MRTSPEAARGSRFSRGKVISAAGLCLLLVFGQTMPLLANPAGGQVAAGSATISPAGNTLNINQTTDRAIINWQSFSINAGETTKFFVPNSGSATLNRVTGGNPSAIYGSLQSNGQVFLINPSGILVGPTGRIDTASFLGSTLDVNDRQFLQAGDLHFVSTSDGRIDNAGVINATGGDVYLIATQVNNTGMINASKGNVGLTAGTDILFQQAGDQHLFVQATPSGTKRATGVTNAGTIRAASAELKAAGGNAYALAINNTGHIAATGYKKLNGQVYLTADGGDIVNSGQISAKTATGSGGRIVLNSHGTASSGTVTNSGTLDASGRTAGRKGGTIQVLGNKVAVTGTVDVSGAAGGGTALIGGDAHGSNPAVVDADQTYLGPDAAILADALTSGNGGKVILWGNETTQVYGRISVQGGAQSGNGGFVETSAATLDARTAPDVSASHGVAGTWLLDPSTVIISDQASDSGFSSPPAFTISSGNVTISQATLLSALISGNVTINASQGTGGNGTITWTQPGFTAFDIGAINGHTLTLAAPTEVLLSGINISPISTSTGKLNLTINSGASSGNVQIKDSAILLNGGNFTAFGTGFASTTLSTSIGQADGVDINDTTLDAGGGNISITGQAGYFQNTFFGPTAVSAGSGVNVVFGSVVETSGAGTITIVGKGGVPITSTTSLTGVNISNQDGSSSGSGSTVVSGNGLISITGTVSSGTVNGVGEIYGLAISGPSQVEATGPTGAVTLLGDTTGSTATAAENIGVLIEGYDTLADVPGTATISVGSLFSSTGGTGISITGYAGTATSDVSHDTSATGLNLSEGASVTASGVAPITLGGLGGTNTNTDSSGTGSAKGVDLSTDQHGSILVASNSGNITINGTGGTSAFQAIGVLIAAVHQSPSDTIDAEVTTNGGNLTISAAGGLGYNGDGSISPTAIPSYGIAVADHALLQTAGSGTINLTATGTNESFGVIAFQLPSGFDSSPVMPTIQSGGALTLLGQFGTGVYVNASITAASATLGSGTAGNFASIPSGQAVIANSTITLTGGAFNVFGAGNAGHLTGIDISSSTIDAQGGSLGLTGKMGVDGSNFGVGVDLSASTLETTGSGAISIAALASPGAITLNSDLYALLDFGSTLQTQNGGITLTGTASSGTSALGFSIWGLQIYNGTVKATGTGAVSITGTTTGSTGSQANIGAGISGSSYISVVNGPGSGTALAITGTAGRIASSPTSSLNRPETIGLTIEDSTTVYASGSGSIVLTGTAGADVNTDPAVQSQSVGFNVASDGSGNQLFIVAETGTLSLNGTGGAGHYDVSGLSINQSNGAKLTIRGTSGNLSLTGTVNTASTVTDAMAGVAIDGGSVLSADDGSLVITGTVLAGSAYKLAGVVLSGGSTAAATGTGGSGSTANGDLTIIGDTTGSTGSSFNAGVALFGTGTSLNATGGAADAGGHTGLTVKGTAGAINGTTGGVINSSVVYNPATAGIFVSEGAMLLAGASAPMTLNGTGGASTNTDSLAASVGVMIFSPVSAVTTGIDMYGSSSPLSITAKGGSSTHLSAGFILGGPGNAGTADITVAQGITINGTGGAGASGSLPNAGIILDSDTGAASIDSYYQLVSLTGAAGSGSSVPGVMILSNSLVSGNSITLDGTASTGSPYGVLASAFGVSPTQPELNAGSGAFAVTTHKGGIFLNAVPNSGGGSNTLTTPTGTSSVINNSPTPLALSGGSFQIVPQYGLTLGTVSVEGLTVVATGGSVAFNGTTHVSGTLDVTSGGYSASGAVTAGTMLLDISGTAILGATTATTGLYIAAGDVSQTGALITPLLDFGSVLSVTLTNTGNQITMLNNIYPSSHVSLYDSRALTIAGVITGNEDLLIQVAGGNLTLGAAAQISGNTINLVTDKYFINQSSAGSGVLTPGNAYYIYALDPSGTQLGGLTPDFTLYNVTYPQSSLPSGNGVLYANQNGPPPPPPPPDQGGSQVPPAVTPQNSQIAPQQPPPPLGPGNTFQPVSYAGNGDSTQVGGVGGQLADTSGNAGTVGSGDAAQLGGGGINNVHNPAASNFLNQALSPDVRDQLAAALQDVGQWTATDAAGGAAPAANNEVILDAGDVGQIGGNSVKQIDPASAPKQLRDAMNSNFGY